MTAESAPRGPYKKGVRRRAEIIEQAVDVFGKLGYHGGSLRQIAAQVGVEPSTVLHYFGSKEELLTEVLSHWDERSELESEGGADFINVQRLVVAHNITIRGMIELFATMSTEATDPAHPAHDFFVERYRAVVALFTRTLESIPPGENPSTMSSPATEARLLIAVMDGLQIQWLLDPDFDMLGTFEVYLDALLERVLGADNDFSRADRAPELASADRATS